MTRKEGARFVGTLSDALDVPIPEKEKPEEAVTRIEGEKEKVSDFFLPNQTFLCAIPHVAICSDLCRYNPWNFECSVEVLMEGKSGSWRTRSKMTYQQRI